METVNPLELQLLSAVFPDQIPALWQAEKQAALQNRMGQGYPPVLLAPADTAAPKQPQSLQPIPGQILGGAYKAAIAQPQPVQAIPSGQNQGPAYTAATKQPQPLQPDPGQNQVGAYKAALTQPKPAQSLREGQKHGALKNAGPTKAQRPQHQPAQNQSIGHAAHKKVLETPLANGNHVPKNGRAHQQTNGHAHSKGLPLHNRGGRTARSARVRIAPEALHSGKKNRGASKAKAAAALPQEATPQPQEATRQPQEPMEQTGQQPQESTKQAKGADAMMYYSPFIVHSPGGTAAQPWLKFAASEEDTGPAKIAYKLPDKLTAGPSPCMVPVIGPFGTVKEVCSRAFLQEAAEMAKDMQIDPQLEPQPKKRICYTAEGVPYLEKTWPDGPDSPVTHFRPIYSSFGSDSSQLVGDEALASQAGLPDQILPEPDLEKWANMDSCGRMMDSVVGRLFASSSASSSRQSGPPSSAEYPRLPERKALAPPLLQLAQGPGLYFAALLRSAKAKA